VFARTRSIIANALYNNVGEPRQIRRFAVAADRRPMTETVLVADEGGVRLVRMNRPEKKNALTQPMYEIMTRALREAAASEAIRCLVLAGGPGAFCAGADIGEFLEAAQSGGLRPKTVEFLHALARNPKPLVAAVDGLAVGIGTTMLLHCDYVVAGSNATFATPFSKLGLIPEAGSSLLAPLRMGHARAFSLLAMGHPLSAEAAKEAGLVNEVVDPALVEQVALKAAQEIAALPAGAIAVSRALLRGEPDDVVKRIDIETMHFRERLQSDEARAAFAAFLSRKK
jgi:enoyl-CoA hydratase/carnithine racemase